MGDIQWTRTGAKRLESLNGRLYLVTDETAGYQILSNAIPVDPGKVPVVRIRGEVERGAISIGLLNEDQTAFLGSRGYDVGPFDDRLIFKSEDSSSISIVISNSQENGESEVSLDGLEITMVENSSNGLPLSELEDQGWNIGYSAAGTVEAVGEGVSEFSPGDEVACGGAGQANHADYVSVPRNLVCRIPKGCSVKHAATATVGTVALQGVRRAQPQIGERICVLGLGLIGQMAVQLLRAHGCKVIGLDLNKDRVSRAIEAGMDAGTSDPSEIQKLINDLTGGRGADRTLITASGKTDAVINQAMEVTRAKGTVVIVGDVGLNVRREVFYKKEIDLLMSTSYGPGRYDDSYEAQGLDYPFAYVRWTLNRNMQTWLELIADGRVQLDALIDQVVSIEDAPAAYAVLAKGGDDAPMGVLLRYPNDSRDLPEPANGTRVTVQGHRTAPEGPVHYALVGAGAFGTSMLVPQMQKRKDRFFLRGVVSRNASVAGNYVRENQIEVLASDLDTILDDPDFQLVVIATRHHEHAEQVARSLEAGKHVFVEKPLALTWEGLERVSRVYEASGQNGPLLMVGFNRRFSPAVQRLKEVLADRRTPLVMSYRLNGGYIPTDHWIQTEHGGGRNIGEACHIYDVFRFLAGESVVGISASAINPGNLPYLRNDNFCATMSYQDGSLGNLVYSALGPKQGLSKERLEVFCDGEAWVLDDFKCLSKSSDGQILWQSSTPDKGHAEELSRFGDAIAGKEEIPIPFDEIVETTALSLYIEDMLHGRGQPDVE